MKANQAATVEDLLAHEPWVRQLAKALVLDPGGADDIVQETWRRVLEHPPQGVRDPRAWLGAAVRNAAASLRRDDSSRRRRERAAARPERVLTERLDRVTLHRDLVDAVLALEEGQRDALLARYFDGLAPRQIAAQQGLSIGTVKSRLHRGLEQLRARLDGEYGDRRAWCLALLPLAEPATVPAVGALALGAAGLLIASAAVTAWALWPRDVQVERHAAVAPALADGQGRERVLPAGGPQDPGAAAAGVESRAAQGGPELKVVDAMGAPVSGAQVSFFRQEDQLRDRARTDADGSVSLPGVGHYLVAVEPEEGLGDIDFHRVKASGLRIQLPPSGSLQVTFRDQAGRRVEGVEVRLATGESLVEGEESEPAWVDFARGVLEGSEPVGFVGRTWELLRDRGSSRSLEDLEDLQDYSWPRPVLGQTTGEAGTASWSGLYPGSGWHLVLLSDHHLAATSFAPEAAGAGAGELTLASSEPLDLRRSAPLTVRANEEVGAELQLLTGSVLIGAVDPAGAAWAQAPQVIVKSVLTTGSGFVSHLDDSRAAAAQDGSFRLENLRPGRKLVSITWTDDRQRQLSVEEELELAPGEVFDMGLLSASPGRSLELRFVLRDGQGRELPPSALEQVEGVAPLVLLGLQVDHEWVPGLDELSPVPGDTLSLAGVPDGDHFSLNYSLVEGLHPAAGFLAQQRGVSLEGALPDDGVIEVPLVLLRSVESTLRLTGLGEGDVAPKRILLHGARSARVTSPGAKPTPFEAVAGHYQVTSSIGSLDPFPGLYCEGEVEVRDGAEVVLEVQPAAGVRGRVDPGVHALGFGLGGEVPDFPARTPWACAVEDDGSFRMGGLPPNRSFYVRFRGTYHLVETGEPGSVVSVDWTTD